MLLLLVLCATHKHMEKKNEYRTALATPGCLHSSLLFSFFITNLPPLPLSANSADV